MDGNNFENDLNNDIKTSEQPVAPVAQPVAPMEQPVAPVAQPMVSAERPIISSEQPLQNVADASDNSIDEAMAEVMAESAISSATAMDQKKSNKTMIILAAVAAVLIVAMVAMLVVMNFIKPGTTGGNSGGVVDNGGGSIQDDEPIENTELSAGTVTTTIDGQEVAYSAAYLVDGIDATIGSGTYESAVDGQTVFLVINGGSLTIKGEVNINKTGTGALQGEGGDSYGLNSAIVVFGEGSSATINGATITTSAPGANAIAAMAGATVDVQDATIETSADNSRGLYAVYGGVITANTVTISTRGSSSAALATDRGEGSITASDMVLSTEGAGSPLIYSTGEITVSSSTGTANGAQIAVIDGKNSITLDSCDFSTNGIGNRNSIDNAAVMIYQSTPSDASEEAGSFTAADSTFTILSSSSVYTTAPFFFITNTVADIDLTDVKASFYADGYFVLASGTSEWGTPGENGATVTFSAVRLDATNQNIGIDENSSVTGL